MIAGSRTPEVKDYNPDLKFKRPAVNHLFVVFII